MTTNLDKPQAVAVVKRTKDENITFNLDNNIIKLYGSCKTLGVTSDLNLNFSLYISNVCKKHLGN